MRLFKYNYSRGTILTMIFSACLCNVSFAQTGVTDSLITKQEKLVDIAYGTQPSCMVTSAVSSISGSELLKTSVPNFANILAGRLLGLTVRQSTGEPGYDSPVLNSRGLRTFGTGNKLLIIVDGFEAPIEQLVPDEVESVVLLKDASSAAIYGNRAANGVLMVTTRRGQEGPLKIGFTAQHGFQNITRMPDFLGSYDYATLYNEGLVNDGKSGIYDSDDLDLYRTGSDPLLYPDVNWYDEIMRKSAPYYKYGLTFTGGNNTVRYFGLLNIVNSDGMLIKAGDMSEFSKNSKYNRYNFRTNIDLVLSKRLTSTFIIGGTVEDKANPGTYETTNELFTLMATIPPNAFPVKIPFGAYGGSNIYTNPLGDVLRTGYYASNGRTATTTVKLTEQLDFITEGLSLSAALSFNTFFRSYGYKTRTYKRFAVSEDALGNIVYTGIGQETSLTGNESLSNQWRNYGIQTFLNYNRTFGAHKLDAFVMSNADEYVVTGSTLSYKHLGIGGRMTYMNNDKYIGEFSFGYNGTENFPDERRMGFFPAISLGWIVSKERFLEGNSLINYLKLRGSYGLSGNADIGGLRYMYDQYWGGAGSYYLGRTTNTSVSTTVEGSIANPDVTWEKEKDYNFGIEATLFNGLDIAFDLFSQERYDILSKPNLTVPKYLGLTMPDLNVGKVSNKGIEAMVRYNSSSRGNLQHYVAANIWYARNEILYKSEALQVNEYLYRTGHQINQPFLLEAEGFFNDQPDIDNNPRQIFTVVKPGDLKYKDQNGDNKVNQYDYYPIGYTDLPEISAGLNGGLKYKNFDLDLFFHAVTNRSVYWSGLNFYAFQNNAKVSSVALGRWTPATATSATYPRLSASNNLNNFQPSSFWQHDGSFIKLRSLEVGYTIPGNLTNKIKVGSARAYINCTNLFSLDHMDGFTDPEILTGYPAVRTVTMGVRVQM